LVGATPFQWTEAAGGNGHWYEVVDANYISWSTADAAAKLQTYNGISGHLATLTSAGENTFVKALVDDGRHWASWIGGFQPENADEPDGDWTWVTGEPWSYANWNNGEPNDSGGEDSLVIYYSGTWNDQSGTLRRYVVEYENPVPIPGAVWLLGSGLLGLIGVRRRRV
ncbi:MAG: C-type lectin domain-containing protein, partial [Deltaproteobacteria bacterium]|nr:C-type lectin domain-containing protein [Deltaproteobacteria bacterium]